MLKDGPFLKIIEKLREDAPKFNERTKEALVWYKRKIDRLIKGKKDPQKIYEYKDKPPIQIAGQLLTFVYDPISKYELPYFDKYPLCLVLKLTKNGFIGLNFHYLTPMDRAIFMDSLYKYFGERRGQGVIKITYDILKGPNKFRYHKACIKRYCYEKMSSRISIISPDLWDVALFVPSEKFLSFTGNKTSSDMIQEYSKRIYRK